MENDPEYIVYFTYLDSKIFLNIIRWSDRALLEVSIRSIIRKNLTKNFICRLGNELMNSSDGFMDPVEIMWSDNYSEDTAFDWYMSTDLDNLEEVLKELDPGKLIDLYCVY